MLYAEPICTEYVTRCSITFGIISGPRQGHLLIEEQMEVLWDKMYVSSIPFEGDYLVSVVLIGTR